MKKKLICLFVLVNSAIVLFAKDINFTITPKIGYAFNNFEEYIYSARKTDKEVSYLDWDAKKLWNIGLETSFIYKNLNASWGLNYSLPFECGKMYDSDYNIDYDIKNTYSISELNCKYNVSTNLTFSYEFNCFSFLSIIPVTSIDYEFSNYEARDGYGWYGSELYSLNHNEVSWDDPNARYFPAGKLNGIDFIHHSLFTFIGVGLKGKVDKMSAAFYFSISPFTYFYTLDSHLSKKRTYNMIEKQNAYWNQYKLNFNVYYLLSKRLSPELNMSYLFGKTVRGKFYNDYYNDNICISDQESGFCLQEFNISLGLKITLCYY